MSRPVSQPTPTYGAARQQDPDRSTDAPDEVRYDVPGSAMDVTEPEPWEDRVSEQARFHHVQRETWGKLCQELEGKLQEARYQYEAHGMAGSALQEVLGAHARQPVAEMRAPKGAYR